MARAGRKPKLTPEMIQRVGNALREGNYIETACDYAGISRSIFYAWLQEAEKPNAKKIFLELKDTVDRARAEAELRNVRRIQIAAEGIKDKDGNYTINPSWQASAWWLERSHSKKWGRQQKVELSGIEGAPINISLDAKERLLEIIRQKNAQKTEE
jgi:hypothetical protein